MPCAPALTRYSLGKKPVLENSPPSASPASLAAEPGNGPPAPGYGEILRFTVPLMMGMVTVALHTIVDTAFVGRLGTAPLAALGLANLYYFTVLVAFLGLAVSEATAGRAIDSLVATGDERFAHLAGQAR